MSPIEAPRQKISENKIHEKLKDNGINLNQEENSVLKILNKNKDNIIKIPDTCFENLGGQMSSKSFDDVIKDLGKDKMTYGKNEILAAFGLNNGEDFHIQNDERIAVLQMHFGFNITGKLQDFLDAKAMDNTARTLKTDENPSSNKVSTNFDNAAKNAKKKVDSALSYGNRKNFIRIPIIKEQDFKTAYEKAK